MKFRDLKVGDKFYINGIPLMKIKDCEDSPLSLKRRATNAINLRNNHQMVVGNKVDVILEESDET